MLAIERRNEILEKLQTDRRVVVSELSQIYEVSEETIRRDLDKLVNDGYAIKSYGGAVINEYRSAFQYQKEPQCDRKTTDCRAGGKDRTGWRQHYAGCEFYRSLYCKRTER